jgi:hypothetical protein
MLMKKFLFPALLFLFTPALLAQELEWKAGMYHFFDNTEFLGSSYINDQTMAGIRVMPEIGWGFEGKHHFRVGFDALKSYGTNSFIDNITPTAYYLYDNGRFRFTMGSFAREGQTDEFSRAFFQDSIRYYRPNMNGFMLAYRGNDFRAKAFLDWTGKQAQTVHEAFFVGGSIWYGQSLFFAEAQALMFHYAGSFQQRGVHDNILLHPAVGIDLAGKTWLDSLRMNVGLLYGMEKFRMIEDEFSVTGGLLVELEAAIKGFGVNSSTFWGKGIMRDYASMGSALYWGDPLYRGNFYSRLDVSYDFLKLPYVKAKLNLANHFSEGNLYLEQSLVVQVALDSNSKPSHGKK